MALNAKERREYFRIKNWIVINHHPIDSLDNVPPIEEVSRTTSPKIKLLQAFTQLEQENNAILNALTDKSSDFAQHLTNQNKKFSELGELAVQSLQTDTKNLTEVDISGGGLRFSCKEKYAIDQLIKIEIILVPECVGVAAYARVVDSHPADSGEGFEVAVIFVKLTEADRDAIIKHVFQVQSKQLREVSKKNGDSQEN